MHTGRLTEKTDVYSFGVILVELLTRDKPTSKVRTPDERNIISHFIWAVKDGKLLQVVDAFIVEETNKEELQVLAELAISSLSLRGKDRPTMKEIEITLEGLTKGKKNKQKQRSHIYSMEDRSIFSEASTSIEKRIKMVESMTKEVDLKGMFSHSSNLAR